MFQADKIENTLVATRLIATTVRIEIDMRDRLSDAEAAADKRIAIGVDSCDEDGIGWIEPNHRRRVAEMRFGRIEALQQRNQTDVRSFVDRCCNRTHFRRFARFRRVLRVLRISSPCKQFPTVSVVENSLNDAEFRGIFSKFCRISSSCYEF